MATSFFDSEQSELAKKFESWLTDKIKVNSSNTDASMFINYILSTLSEEDNTDEEKSEAIQPFLHELNQNNSFDEEQLVLEIIQTWNQMKQEHENQSNQVTKKIGEDEPNPTDTILNMINKHKTQLVKVKKSEINEDDYEHAHNFAYEESDEDEEVESKKDQGLFENKNTTDALNREKQKREKIAEAHHKQKEQAKKALIEQKQREEEKKKKAQQKAAKVERKR